MSLLKKDNIQRSSNFENSKPNGEIPKIKPEEEYIPTLKPSIQNKKRTYTESDVTTARISKDALQKIKIISMVKNTEAICYTIDDMIDVYLESFSEKEKEFYDMYISLHGNK